MSSKYLRPENKDKTVLCALAGVKGYSEFSKHTTMIDNDKLIQIISDYVEQGKYIFITFCQNQVELKFCQTIIKLKLIYPYIKLIYVTNNPYFDSTSQNNKAFQIVRKENFDEILNFQEDDEQFYMHLFNFSSLLFGVYSRYEILVKQFCKLARLSGIEIVNLYQQEEVDINTVLTVTHEIFDGLPVSTIPLVINSTKYQQLIMQIQELLTYIDTKNIKPKDLLTKINQLERKYNELHQHISAYFFLSNFMESTH